MLSTQQIDQKRFSYADYLTWDDDKRWELIDGEPVLMSPAPNRLHQTISRRMLYQIENYLRNKPCEMFPAPFDVRLEAAETGNELAFHVVQPDIVVVCDPSKLDDHGCIGAPDWIIEITSPATASHDHIVKRAIYERFGVKEYWIIQPVDQIVMVYLLNDTGCYGKPDVYCREDPVQVGILPELRIELKEIFDVSAAAVCQNHKTV